MFLQLLLSGIAFGSLYALIALAMVIIYKTSEVPNFGQGEMAMLSTFVAFMLLDTYGHSFFVSFLGALVFAALLGVFLEFVFLRRAKDPNILSLILITLGFEMILYGVASWKWGADQRDLSFPVSDFDLVNIGPAVISYLNLATLLVALVLMVLLFLFFRYTKVGIAMKATQQNPMAARINGIRVNRILSVTWAMSSTIGAMAGMLLAPVATLDPNLMLEPLLKGFASAVLGGMTTLVGAALGGYMLGIIENLFGGYVSLEFKSIVAFGIIVLVLCFRPSGLFAKHYVRKV
ncbi:MAG: branched-chain amino acid ABC transporter permease [Deltaproteobacteria bacterium CG_4_8_14_3_um_filter_51_11]|nr:branched-chain amino acid ABC transporter permease [bacterium]OIP39841.1 MAG: branched-chain amino acid ABC transporter permease [Desulfobacteraceae bacterium CG2_30_51_40]PIP45810.1 MAG: branched-chain amino acid ABC transporter permease [Deltaproteobacteria bacterium CG23_combo_of_CG06-09_8_20_14_all_51_20]PIW02054.1 MAG: branched-chain amino acid ABC transporter permease [Deltaproteobacteria bacterium CG17_big_fil_post_rev_8_21_14_2_50_51_6]PIX20971.1 MAG: branched-chain amino acid ABC tr